MTRVQIEAPLTCQPASDRVQQVRRKIDDAFAVPTQRVQVLLCVVCGGQVVHGGTVPHVNVRDHTELGQEVQRSVDRRQVDSGMPLLDLGTELHGAGMATLPGECLDDGPASPRDTVVLDPEPVDRSGEGSGDERLVRLALGGGWTWCEHSALSQVPGVRRQGDASLLRTTGN